jgi:hypothetical protein
MTPVIPPEPTASASRLARSLAFFSLAASGPKADPSRAGLFDQSDLLFVG